MLFQHLLTTRVATGSLQWPPGMAEMAVPKRTIVIGALVAILGNQTFAASQLCTVDGERCVMPFRFKGVMNTACTVQDGGPPWCSTKTDSYDNHIGNGGHWGDCAPCPTGTTATPVRSTQMACNPGTKCLSTWCHCPLGSKWECVDPDWICDDTEDCDNGEDEKGCGVTATPAKTVTTTTG